MCGLIGHLGNKANLVNIDKLNILGILNETRGVDSCGVTMDGEILKGVDSIKAYRDFVAFYQLSNPGFTTGVIGHTRKATFGIHSAANAHPFGFGSFKIKGIKEPVFEFVGVHNGTLLNHTDLANNGGVKLTKKVTETIEETISGKKVKKTETKEVSKIDSEILLERLYKDGDYRVLSEYNGAAALIWQDLRHPNKMFFYHGKSKKDEFDTELVEERPLYYWKENKNSMYVSSILDSLYIIGGSEKTIFEFKCNTVYEVTNGDISKAKKTSIDRSKNWKTKGYNSAYRRNQANYAHGPHSHIANPRNSRRGNLRRPFTAKSIKALGNAEQLKMNLEVPVDKGLLQEKFDFDPNLNRGLTVCKQLRYWRNGHLADGVYAYVCGHGFYHLGMTQKCAISSLEGLAGQFFYDKDFHKSRPTGSTADEVFVPFPKTPVDKDPLQFLHYMFEGIRIRTYSDWTATCAQAKDGKYRFDVTQLSMISCHPIIDVKNPSDKRVNGAYYDGTLAETAYTFLGSRKLYSFTAGQIKNISYIQGLEPDALKESALPVYSTMSDAARFLEQSTKVNGYADLKEIELQAELASLDEVIDNMKETKEVVIRKVSDRIEDEIEKILVEGFVTSNEPDYHSIRGALARYVSGSTKAKMASGILTQLITLKE